MTNSLRAEIYLLERIKSTKFLYPSEMSQTGQNLQGEKNGLQVFLTESLDEMLLGDAEHYPYVCITGMCDGIQPYPFSLLDTQA